MNGDGLADFEEYVFPCDPENLENLHIQAGFLESERVADGNWVVEIPLKDIVAGNIEAPAE